MEAQKNYAYDFILPFFTAEDALRPAMEHPHNAGDGFVYATDAHLLVRIPESKLTQDYKAVEKFPNAAKLLNETLSREGNTSKTIELSDLVRVLSKAKWCKETECDSCPDCEGTGTEECPHCGNEEDCDRCKGKGEINPRMKQFSLLKNDDYYKIRIGEVLFQATFLHIIAVTAKMLGVESIEYISDGNPTNAGIFRFGGVDILLMPIMGEDEDAVIIANA